MIGMKLENDKQVDRALANLGKKTARKIVKPALKAGRKTTLAYAKTNARNMVGGRMGHLLAKHLKSYVSRQRDLKARDAIGQEVRLKANVPEFEHYPMGSSSNITTKKTTGQKSYIPWAIEYGHVGPGRAGNKGPKVAAPIPFLRNAHLLTKQKSLALAKSHILAGIRREWAKAS